MEANQAQLFHSVTVSDSSKPLGGSRFQSLGINQSNQDKGSDQSEENVKIFIRIKPLRETNSYGTQNESHIQIAENGKLLLYYPAKEAYKKFTFENTFEESSTQEEVFRKSTAPLLKHCLLGYNATVFVYGQTGTGKTYTMGLSSKVTTKSAGVIPFTLKYLFDYFRSAETEYEEQYKWNLDINLVQIYLDEVYDLLNPGAPTLLVREDPQTKEVYLQNLISARVNSFNQAVELINAGIATRANDSKKLDEKSSRSHLILTLEINQLIRTPEGLEKAISSKLTLLDLAGSERVSKTGSAALGNVIAALGFVGKNQFIPYRTSKFTRVLQNSLNSSSKISLIATVSGHPNHFNETLATLLFAQRCKTIVLKPVPSPNDNNKEKLENEFQIKQKEVHSHLYRRYQAHSSEVQQLSKDFYIMKQGYKSKIQQCENEIKDLKKLSAQLQRPFKEPDQLPIDLQDNLEKAEYLYKLLRSCRDLSYEKIDESISLREALLEDFGAQNKLNLDQVHDVLRELDAQFPNQLYDGHLEKDDNEEYQSLTTTSLEEAMQKIQKVGKLLVDSINKLSANSENAEKLKLFLATQRETISVLNKQAKEKNDQFEEALVQITKRSLDQEMQSILLKNPTLDKKILAKIYLQKEKDVEDLLRAHIAPKNAKFSQLSLTESTTLERINKLSQTKKTSSTLSSQREKERLTFHNFDDEIALTHLETDFGDLKGISFHKKPLEVEEAEFLDRSYKPPPSTDRWSDYAFYGDGHIRNFTKETANSSDEDVTEPLPGYSIISPRHSSMRSNQLSARYKKTIHETDRITEPNNQPSLEIRETNKIFEDTKRSEKQSDKRYFTEEDSDLPEPAFLVQSQAIVAKRPKVDKFETFRRREELERQSERHLGREEKLNINIGLTVGSSKDFNEEYSNTLINTMKPTNAEQKISRETRVMSTFNNIEAVTEAVDPFLKTAEDEEITNFEPPASYKAEMEKSISLSNELAVESDKILSNREETIPEPQERIPKIRGVRMPVKSQFGFFGLTFPIEFKPSQPEEEDKLQDEEDLDLYENKAELIEEMKDEIAATESDSNTKPIEDKPRFTLKLESTNLTEVISESKIEASLTNKEEPSEVIKNASVESDKKELNSQRKKIRKEKRHITDYSKFNETNVDLLKIIEAFDIRKYVNEEMIRHKGNERLNLRPFEQLRPVALRRTGIQEELLVQPERDGGFTLPTEFCTKIYRTYKKAEKSSLDSKMVIDQMVIVKEKPHLSKINRIQETKEEIEEEIDPDQIRPRDRKKSAFRKFSSARKLSAANFLKKSSVAGKFRSSQAKTETT